MPPSCMHHARDQGPPSRPPVHARVNGTNRASFPYWARLEDDAIRACRADHTNPARRGLRYAVGCTLTARALL